MCSHLTQSSNPLLSFFSDAHIGPDLANGSAFKVALVSFWHDFLTPWARPYLGPQSDSHTHLLVPLPQAWGQPLLIGSLIMGEVC